MHIHHFFFHGLFSMVDVPFWKLLAGCIRYSTAISFWCSILFTRITHSASCKFCSKCSKYCLPCAQSFASSKISRKLANSFGSADIELHGVAAGRVAEWVESRGRLMLLGLGIHDLGLLGQVDFGLHFGVWFWRLLHQAEVNFKMGAGSEMVGPMGCSGDQKNWDFMGRMIKQSKGQTTSKAWQNPGPEHSTRENKGTMKEYKVYMGKS